jgi:hypothetical protein
MRSVASKRFEMATKCIVSMKLICLVAEHIPGDLYQKSQIISSYVNYLLASSVICLRSFSTEEVNIGKLLHLVDIATQSNFLVVEQDPSRVLADESDIVTIMLVSVLYGASYRI